jgi:cell division protein FtsL
MKEAKKGKSSRFAKVSISIIFWTTLSILLAMFFLVIIGNEISNYNNYANQAQELTDKINAEQQRGRQLDAELHRNNMDEQIERIAREQLGLVMPDEIIFIRDNRN